MEIKYKFTHLELIEKAKTVAFWSDGTVLPPCGRCREFMYQVDKENLTYTDVILEIDTAVKLQELLPQPYETVECP